MVDRGLDKEFNKVAGRDVDYASLRDQFAGRQGRLRMAGILRAVPYLYTSGTTGKPKGVQRDTGGYAVALASSMKHIYCGGEAKLSSPPPTLAGWSVTLHHLRPADRRHGHRDVRRHAAAPGCRGSGGRSSRNTRST